jgi:PAS domain S-box-containing protein
MGKFFANPSRRRSLAYVALGLGLTAVRVPVGQISWVGNAEIHTFLETIATLLAFVIGAMALVRYYTRKTAAYLILGSGFLGTGLLDGYHAIVTSPFCTDCTPSSLSALIPWTGAISRLFLSLLIGASLFIWRGQTQRPREDHIRERTVYLLVGGWTLASFAFFLWVPLVPAYQSQWVIHRPGEMITGLFFAIATVGYLRKTNWRTDGFTHSLVLFLIVATLSEVVYMSFSARLFDALHLASHVLKILAYTAVLSGLFQSMYSVFRRESEAVDSLTRANESLALEVGERQLAEAALEQSRDELESRVAARTVDLAEQGELAALVSEIAILLTEGGAIQKTLQRSAELISHFLNAAFVRIWTLNKNENVLELQASAGMYTHLNGGHARVPVGQFKIGRIAQEGQPHLTNNVPGDSWVGDPDWARREGMIAFAGYPLIVGDEVVGVVAGFARQPFSKAVYQTFGSLAGSISQFIGRKRMEAALQDSEERVRLLLDSTAEAIYGMDLAGNCTLANRACLRMLAYENAEQLLGNNMHEVLHHTRVDGTPYPVAECHIFQAFRKGEGTHVDDEVMWRADGTSFPAEYWSYPVRSEGEIVGAVVTFLDISERKHAEDSLRTSEERFRIAAENGGDMTIEWDLRTGQVERFGLHSELLGDRPAPDSFEAWKSMVHPDDLEQVLAGIGRHIETGERYVTQYRVVGERGSIYHYSLRGQAIRNAGGEPQKWIGLVSDITESKLAEEAISQLAAIVQCSEDAIIGTSLSCTITTWNGGAERLLGYTALEALGASLSILFRRAEQAWDILDPSSRGAVNRLDEAVFVCKEGLEVSVSLTVSPIRKASGEITGVATIARDISARKKAEIALAHQAQHDHLTGLPNTLLLADRLASSIQRAIRSGLMTAVIYVDLDGFKFVNDTLGHEAGDTLLKLVTGRLQACLREPDTLARMGGDEFMVVIGEVKDDAIANSIAEN